MTSAVSKNIWDPKILSLIELTHSQLGVPTKKVPQSRKRTRKEVGFSFSYIDIRRSYTKCMAKYKKNENPGKLPTARLHQFFKLPGREQKYFLMTALDEIESIICIIIGTNNSSTHQNLSNIKIVLSFGQ